MSKHRIVRKSALITITTILLAVPALVVALPVLADGPWRAEYYNNRDLSGGPILVRYEAGINYDWGRDGPGDGVPATDFSVRWTAFFEFEEGTYRFSTRTDDGVRVWVDDALVIDRWFDHPVEAFSAEHGVGAGYHNLRVEYYQAVGEAVCQVWWERVSQPPSYSGWKGEYYSNRWLTGPPVLTRNDAEVNFNWGYASPGVGVPADLFSARWTRNEYFGASGNYAFTIRTDDGMRLWVDGVLVIDAWKDQSPTSYSNTIYLAAGHHYIQVDHYENTGVAVAQLSYQAGGAPSPTEIIVDDLNSSFIWGGPTGSWYPRSVGYASHMFWTWNGSTQLYNWGKWIPSLPGAGNYEVYAYIPSRYAGTSSARYRIFHSGQRHDKIVSQTRYYNQWVSLGTYYFAAAGDEYVFLGDNTGERYATRFVGFDAMKWVRRDAAPPPPPPPVPPPSGCTITPVLGFGRVWSTQATVQAKLGCPLAAEQGVWGAEEVFIGGYMFWRQDAGHVYVLYNDGTWQAHSDTWAAGMPEWDPSIVPPTGYYQPVRGFGKLWRENLGIQQKLSWATAQERSVYFSQQDYSGGMMLWSNVLGIFVLYNDGSWAHYY